MNLLKEYRLSMKLEGNVLSQGLLPYYWTLQIGACAPDVQGASAMHARGTLRSGTKHAPRVHGITS